MALFDAEYHADPYPEHHRLREEAPAHRVTLPDGQTAWIVTRAVDVQRLFGDARMSLDKANSRDAYVGFSLPPELDANLLSQDGDNHQRLRRIVSKAFTARRVELMAEGIQAVATRLVDRLEGPAVDLVPTFAAQLPLHVISDLIGVPAGDRLAFGAWITAMFAPTQPSDVVEAVANLQKFMLELVGRRRTEPGDDLLSAIIQARDEQDRMTENELVSLAFLLLLAGVENVAHVIVNGVVALVDDPALRDPARLPDVVEELLRHAPPLPFAIRRFPLEDIDVDGVTIPAGSTVYLGVMSANRDPARFASPDSFDPSRPAQHFTFGHGPHYCLGAPLARLETRIALTTLFDRYPSLRLAVPVEELPWRSSFRSHALKSLPVALA
ncbi:cytochrome P450 [Kutzneria sp. NPDC052558]|uniref:cytochrome P450 n=1 Tax=Kutzneria sp. NPDC052558 TaxID=3364121 RepID=UPI0037CC859C